MNLAQKVIRPKVGLLDLAKHLGNVSQACTVMGYSLMLTSIINEEG